MFLRAKTRRKDGKLHRYWSVVENRRVKGGRVVRRQVLHLGELNDGQRAGWVRTIETLDGDGERARQMALFADDRRDLPESSCEAVRIRLGDIQLRKPRQWGACWLALHLWEQLHLDEFWQSRLPASRKGTRWWNVLKALVAYRLIDPGSEFRFHRDWYQRTALGDLLGEDFTLAQKDKPYRCLDLLVKHRDELFDYLRQQWGELFQAQFDVLLYDLTSTYFESDPPGSSADSKRRFGYSRDHRRDCTQVVVALVVTPDGLPVAYEVYAGNTHEASTLREFLDRVENRYGRARRTWLMDRGIPTEETLEEMRSRGIDYLVGTPKGRLTKMEKPLLEQPWIRARESVSVKVLQQEDEFYVYVESKDRVAKERSMRRRKLKRLWARLGELRVRKQLSRDALLMSLGAAKKEAGRAWRLVAIHLPEKDEPVDVTTFCYELDREKFRRTMLEAHIFLSFLAYCLHATLRNLARNHAGGLSPRAIVEKLSAMQMIDVHLPTTDGKHIVLSRYTEPEPDVALLLAQFQLTLPAQSPPKVYASGKAAV